MVRIIFALALVMVLAQQAAGQGFTMRMNGDIVIPAGTVHDGLAMTMNGRIQVEGTLQGDAITMNGNIIVGGTVTGSVRTFNGSITLRPTARVEGDVSVLNGHVDRQPGAVVGGRVSEGQIFGSPSPQPTPSPAPPSRPRFRDRFRPWERGDYWSWGFARVLGTWAMLGLVVLAAVVAALFPDHLRRLSGVLSGSPVEALLAGLALWVVIPFAVFVLFFSIVGIPLVIFLPLALAVLATVGFATASMLLGSRLAEAMHGQNTPVVSTLIGGVVLAVLSAFPGLGWLAGGLAITWGVGGVVLQVVHRVQRPRPASESPS